MAPVRSKADALSATFAALADPTRRAILVSLALKAMSVGELAAPYAISLPAVSKHLKVLERAGLVRRSRQAQVRPCRIDAEAMKPAAEWLGQFALLWEAHVDRLEDDVTLRKVKNKRRLRHVR